VFSGDLASTGKGEIMNTSNLIKNLCKEKGISVAELARRIGQTPQNFNKKLKRETVSTEELMTIANELGVVFEQSYILENGEKLTISNES
jgi:conserved domain protein